MSVEEAVTSAAADPSRVEITSPHAGTIKTLNADSGKVVKVGQTLCEIDVDGEVEEVDVPEPPSEPAPTPAPSAPTPPPAPAREAAVPPPPPPPPSAPKVEPVQYDGAAKPHRAARPHPLDETAVRFEGEAGVLPAAPLSRGEVPDSVEARRSGGGEVKRIVKASPATRTLAHKLGIDLDAVTPTGEGGRVTKEDVQRYAEGGAAAPAAAAPSTPAPQAAPAPRAAPVAPRQAAPAPTSLAPAPVYSSHRNSGETTRMELGRTRKAMFKAMGSMGSVPHFGYVHSLDLTNLLPLMKAANPVTPPKPSYLASDVPDALVQHSAGGEREKTSILAFLVKALALALDEHPIMRSRMKERDGERWLEVADDAAIGIAVSDPKAGLLTPSLPPFDPRSSVGSINRALSTLRQTAARPSTPPNITISSVGPLGEAKSAMPVLPPGGGVAIAAVGRAAWENELVLRNGKNNDGRVWDLSPADVAAAGTRPVLKCNVGWSGDHRVLEGAELIAFTETWKRYIEEPWRWVEV